MKSIIFASIKFKPPTKSGKRKFKNLLKYFEKRDGSLRREQYYQLREQAGAYLKHPDRLTALDLEDLKGRGGTYEQIQERLRALKDMGVDDKDQRWVDRGMGSTWSDIYQRADALKGKRVLARALVISPDPALMEHVPEERQIELVMRTTERTINQWMTENGWGEMPYSYVVHDKENEQGKRMLHTHVIMPGTVKLDDIDATGRQELILRKHHLRDYRRTAARSFQEELEIVLGRERSKELIREREKSLIEQRRTDWIEQNPRSDKEEKEYARRQLTTRMYTTMSVMRMLERDKKNREQKKEFKQRQGQEHLYIYLKGQKDAERRKAQERIREAGIDAEIDKYKERDELLDQQIIEERKREKARLKKQHQRALMKDKLEQTFGKLYDAKYKGMAHAGWRDVFEELEQHPLPNRQPEQQPQRDRSLDDLFPSLD